ncbi:MAG: FAD-dependent oxidoreductase [Cyanobacteria bacterium]|nr:FAD-dependent oxidoreductase [Cyanobacteriota bacterium]
MVTAASTTKEVSSKKSDVIVIGAGPGGYVAAIRLAQLGQRVTLIEKEALGGTCLNWGCIPSKALIYATSLYEKIQHADLMGIVIENPRLDIGKLQKWKNDVVQKLTGGIGQLMKAHGVDVVYGTARFENANNIYVSTEAGDVALSAKNFLIATGSAPIQIPGFGFDGETIIESRQALSLGAAPKRLGIMGGGVIGLEIGMMYAKMGSQVTLIEMMPQLLPGIDGEIVQLLARGLKKKGVKVLTRTQAKSQEVVKSTQGQSVKVVVQSLDKPDGPESVETLEFDTLLVSVGRKPHTENLGLDKAGVKLNEKGFIVVDNQLRTSVQNIFAIGDVTSGPLLAHKA